MDNKQWLLLGCGLMTASGLHAQQTERPNIIYIMCDDLGYADLGCYGQQYIHTPHLDRMAQEGMRFTQAYAGSPVSAPSRASFMTGQHTGHTKVRGNREYRIGSMMYGNNQDPVQTGQEPYDTAHVILPEIMKDNGYTTGMFGKWAGGYEGSISTPATRGIDEFYGFMCQFQAHLYYPNFLNAYSRMSGDEEVRREVLVNNVNYAMHGADYKNRRDYSAELVHRRAMEWIDRQTPGKPFFGVLTYMLPHAELAQPEDSIFKSYQGVFSVERTYGGDAASRYNPTNVAHQQFAAMVTRLDMYVGEVLDLLRRKGLDKNTLVIFTSDNGPHTEGGGDPDYFNTEKLLRGTKRSTTEGGIRVPFIAWWPGQVEAGMVNSHQLAFYDLMPTFCELAGIEDYVERYTNPRLENDWFDGLSFAPTLLGEGEQTRHEFLYWEFHETNMMALRMDNWKLVVKNGHCSLYDIATDMHEDVDLASRYPEVVESMKSILLREHTHSDMFRVTLPE